MGFTIKFSHILWVIFIIGFIVCIVILFLIRNKENYLTLYALGQKYNGAEYRPLTILKGSNRLSGGRKEYNYQKHRKRVNFQNYPD